MIPARFYYDIYLTIITILTFVACNLFNFKQQFDRQGITLQYVKVAILTIVLSLFIGLRPVDRVFGDTIAYASHYYHVFGEPFTFDWEVENLISDNLLPYFASRCFPLELFFTFEAFIYFGATAIACLLMFKENGFLAFVCYLGAFSTFSYGTNGLRAGMAASVFLLALAVFERKKYLLAAIFALMSLEFHHGMILPILSFLGCTFFKKPKWFLYLWIFSFFAALFHITYFQFLFGGVADERGSAYLMQDAAAMDAWSGKGFGGFRLDFILYGAAPIAIGWIALKKYNFDNPFFVFCLNLYTFVNAIWMLCMYASFTNRIAYLSWLMLPIALLLPVLKDGGFTGCRNPKIVRYVVYGHLFFTLFMHIVYYG